MEEKWKNFRTEELKIARNASISRVASYLGYTPKRITNVWMTLMEHDSVIIKNDRTYSRNSVTGASGKKEGGTAIDFVKNFTGETDMVQIVQMLCELESYRRSMGNEDKNRAYRKVVEQEPENTEKETTAFEELTLPPKAENYKILYAYLIRTRKLAKETVDFFVRNHLIYESREVYLRNDDSGHVLSEEKAVEGVRHNIVFLGRNKNGEVRFASKRGTMDNYGIRYRGNVAGSDLSCGFQVNVPISNRLYVFEAAIDLMSYCELSGDFDGTNKLALSTVSDAALVQFLKENEQVTEIVFALDRDYAGLKAACILSCKYLGYKIEIENIRAADTPKIHQADESTMLLKLHPDEAVHKNKEMKESDEKVLFSMIGTLRLQPIGKYRVSCEFPECGKDFNETLIYQKERNLRKI